MTALQTNGIKNGFSGPVNIVCHQTGINEPASSSKHAHREADWWQVFKLSWSAVKLDKKNHIYWGRRPTVQTPTRFDPPDSWVCVKTEPGSMMVLHGLEWFTSASLINKLRVKYRMWHQGRSVPPDSCMLRCYSQKTAAWSHIWHLAHVEVGP